MTDLSKVIFLLKKIALFSLFIWLVLHPLKHAAAADINIFILHSYHQEYPWTKLENEGIISTLKSLINDKDVSYSTEYLDTKRVLFLDEYQQFFKNYLQQKYVDYKPDLVFLTDDNALLFYLRYQEELFGDVPVVFCGVNDTDVGDALQGTNYHGIFEVKDINANLLFINDILPDSEKLFFIGDDSSTYRAIRRQIQEKGRDLLSGNSAEFIASSSFTEIVRRLENHQQGVLLLTTIGGFQDEKGNILTIATAIERIQKAGKYIIISMEDVYLKSGVLGGIVTSGKAQGEAAAKKGYALLTDRIPQQFEQGPNIPTFNYEELLANNISLTKLPENTTILNRPLSLYQEFREVFLTVIVAFSLLLIVLVLLSFSVIRRRKAEQALLASESFLYSVLENLPDMVFVKDAEELRFVRLNRAGETFFGATQEEVRGKNDYDFFPLEEADFFIKKDRQTLEEKVLVDIPFEPIHTPSGKRYLHTKKIPIMDPQGKVRYLLGISRDITDIRIAEKRRVELEDKLKQAQKMESIGTLAGGIAHDFNNILSSIIGYTELAQKQADQPEVVDKLLSGTLKGAERAKQLVRQILTFSRKGASERIPIVLADIVSEALDLLRSSLPSTISIEERLESRSRVLADPTQIHQIIMNLGTNGYQAMLDTGGTLVVILDEEEVREAAETSIFGLERGNYLHLSIQDTGKGMEKETLERMFDPYFTTKGPESGTGLGLAVVHGIVKSHDGHISVISELDIGTTIDIYLPITDAQIKNTREGATIREIRGGTESILLIDDEPEIIRMMEMYLKKYGYRVTSFTRSVEALLEFQNAPEDFDLVITDMTMPRMTGTELAEEVFKLNPELPIILCTGHSDNVNKVRALSMGIRAYCEKPMNIDEILATIRDVLDAQ